MYLFCVYFMILSFKSCMYIVKHTFSKLIPSSAFLPDDLSHNQIPTTSNGARYLQKNSATVALFRPKICL